MFINTIDAHSREAQPSPLDDLKEGLPPEEVHRRALAARKTQAKAHRALCFWLVEVERKKIYLHFGASSVFAYAELYLELAPHTIAEYLRTGKEMEQLPLLAEACERGEIAPSKIREISRVATRKTEEQWLSIARSSTCRQIEKLVPLTPRGGLPPCSQTQDEQSVASLGEPEQETSVGPARFHSKMILELENGQMAILSQALKKARAETGERSTAALLEHIARVFLDDTSPHTVDTPPYRITLHSVPGSPVAWIEGASGPHHVPSTTCEEAFCDGEILDVREVQEEEKTAPPPTWESATRDPARHGTRIRRTLPLTLRRKVLERDGRRCTAPGCSHRSFLSLHHIEPVERGGKDREHNLTTVCYRCHRALHTGKLSVSGRAPGKLVWKSRRGIELKGSS